jgi:hypothetical protein
MAGINYSNTSSTFGQRDGHFICRHTQGTILRACDGSSAKQFTNVVVVSERIKLGVKSGRIFAPTEKRGFKRKEVNHIEDSYKGRKNSFQHYHTPS